MDPISPVKRTVATRYLPFGEGGLTVGQVVRARVARIDGDQIQLRWGRQTVSVTSKVPLTVGQEVNLLVEEGSAGKVLLRMVDDILGRPRPNRSEGAPNTRTGGPAGTAPGQSRFAPVAGLPPRTDQDSDASADGGGSSAEGDPDWDGWIAPGSRTRPDGSARPDGGVRPDGSLRPGASPSNGSGASLLAGSTGRTAGGQPLDAPEGPATGTAASPAPGSRSTGTGTLAGPRPGPNGVPAWGGPSTAPVVVPPTDSAALTTLLMQPLDDAAARLSGATRSTLTDLPVRPAASPNGANGPTRAGTPAANGAATGAAVLVARSALPTYGRLAQSIGGADAFRDLLSSLGRDVGRTLARAPLAIRDLGRLLVDVGVHPDEMNAVLVSEMLSQGSGVQEASVRALRRDVAVAGGGVTDAAPAVLLSRLGIPVTALSLAVARQALAGQLDGPAAWRDVLTQLQQLTRGDDAGDGASSLARELLAGWRVPVESGARGVGEWLRTALDQTATPLEAKLARPLASAPDDGPGTVLGQDTRARLDTLAQAVLAHPHEERSSLGQALQRLQATVQGEQILNAATSERSEPHFFAVTLPAVAGRQPGTIELRVRERDANPDPSVAVLRPDVVQLKLSLPALGDLGVHLTVGETSVACHFSAGSAFAEALLDASAGELVGRLKRLGYQQTTVDAAHEPMPQLPPLQPEVPRLHRVDLQA